MTMKYECEVIRDLLPLYADDVCSAGSRKMVEEHLDALQVVTEEDKSASDDRPVRE